MCYCKVATCAGKMAADREDSKLDIDKDSNIPSEMEIYNVEPTNKILGAGSLGSVVEASWYGGPCVAKKVHSKFLESSQSEGELSILGYKAYVRILPATIMNTLIHVLHCSTLLCAFWRQ